VKKKKGTGQPTGQGERAAGRKPKKRMDYKKGKTFGIPDPPASPEKGSVGHWTTGGRGLVKLEGNLPEKRGTIGPQ